MSYVRSFTVGMFGGLVIALAIILVIAVADFAARCNDIPPCEEDEVLVARDYPYTDTDNLKCVHIEEVGR